MERNFINTKHTPGPWTIKLAVHYDEPTQHAASEFRYFIEKANETVEEASANAALIATAPDLLNSLAWITRCAYVDYPIGKAYFISDSKMRNAIELVKFLTGEPVTASRNITPTSSEAGCIHLINALEQFSAAALKLTSVWHEYEGDKTLEAEYPFKASFDEVAIDIERWVDHSTELLTKAPAENHDNKN
jgi:hypothetical protein